MFKADLIENQKYYQIQRISLLIVILGCFLIGLLSSYLAFPTWVYSLLIMVGIGLIVFQLMTIKKVHALRSKQIEISEDNITLKDKKGNIIESIPFTAKQKIFLKKDYQLDDASFIDVLKGDFDQPFITIVDKQQQNRSFEFHIPSEYMVHQLHKLVNIWKRKGLPIE